MVQVIVSVHDGAAPHHVARAHEASTFDCLGGRPELLLNSPLTVF